MVIIMKKTKLQLNTTMVCFLALCAAINLVGSFLALTLRLPIYLDSIGSILASAMLGPLYGMLPGIVSSLISGFTTDLYALYYMPTQMITSILTGIIYRRMQPKGLMLIPAAALISIPGTIVSSIITAVLFGGITSSGSAILVQILSHLGLNLTLSICLVQALTEYADRLVALMLTVAVIAAIPSSVKNLLWKGNKSHGTI